MLLLATVMITKGLVLKDKNTHEDMFLSHPFSPLYLQPLKYLTSSKNFFFINYFLIRNNPDLYLYHNLLVEPNDQFWTLEVLQVPFIAYFIH